MTSTFFLGILAAATLTNAAAVYLFHDVDADRVGNLNLAYRDLTLEFFVYGFVLSVIFLLSVWIGSLVFRLRGTLPNLKLGLTLGIVVTILQYPAEFAVRKLAQGFAEIFLLGYLLVSPVCCAAIILLNSRKRQLTADS